LIQDIIFFIIVRSISGQELMLRALGSAPATDLWMILIVLLPNHLAASCVIFFTLNLDLKFYLKFKIYN